jgi:hypothetical protein
MREAADGETPPPCWCTQVEFSAELLAKVPASLKDRACICPTCARGASQA